MFNLTQAISGVKNWILTEEYLLYSQKKNVILSKKNNFEQIFDATFKNPTVGIYSNSKIWVDDFYSNESHMFLYESPIFKPYFNVKEFGLFGNVVHPYSLCYIVENNKTFTGLYNIELEVILWKIEKQLGYPWCLQEKYIFFTYLTSIVSCLSRNTGELRWEQDILALGGEGKSWQVGRIIGVFEQVLTIMIRHETLEQLVGLDIATGEVLWHLYNTQDPQTKEVVFHNIVPCLGQMQPSSDESRLYGLRYNIFIEIETATGKILRLRRLGPPNNLHFTHQGKEISIKNTRFHEGYFYFTATLQGETFCSGLIGAFEIGSEQIVWLHDMGFTRSGQFFNEGTAPVLDGNRLYVLDHEGTLHIFEKE